MAKTYKRRASAMTASRALAKRHRGASKRVMRKQFRKLGPQRSLNFGTGFPALAKVTHKYRTIQTLGAGLGAVGKFSMRANGMFDPDVTNAGHQPMFFDQFAALYDHYVVIGAKYTVKLLPGSVTQPTFVAALYLNDDASSPTGNISAIAEQTRARTVTVPIGGSVTKTLSMKWSAKKTFGSGVMANNKLQGTGTSDPPELQFFDLYYQSANMLADVSFIADVSVEYIAIWSELKDVEQS